jgi:tRNA pseudouridine13 synthase
MAMKLKQRPADFRVEELTSVTPTTTGPFAFYRLRKTGWTTPDALQVIGRRWNVSRKQISYGGLKDRHADTVQYLTIHHGPARNLTHQRIELTHLGQLPHPYSSRDIRANRFEVTLRGMNAGAEMVLRTAAEQVKRCGVPNYFDDQRFGSVTADGQFVAREMVFGRFEQALRLALTAPYPFDRAAQKQEKAILLTHWGNWPACKAALPKGHARSVVTYLCDHPTNFKGAMARLRPELQGMYLSAYQSELWNRVLANWLKATFPAGTLGQVTLQRGSLPAPLEVPDSLYDRWHTLVLPLASSRLKPDSRAEWLPYWEAVLAEENLTLNRFRIPGMDKPFFSKGDRPACLQPRELTIETAADELNRGWRCIRLCFELPRGCYATMVVKRLTARSNSPSTSSSPPGS